MFWIRVFTPPLAGEAGFPYAGAELRAGATPLRFRIDLSHYRVTDYNRQWKAGIRRLLEGAPTSALLSRSAGADATAHHFWALWRTSEGVFVQSLCILAAELEAPFDPMRPYAHVGSRLPVTECALPLFECCVQLEDVFAAAFDMRWPFGQ